MLSQQHKSLLVQVFTLLIFASVFYIFMYRPDLVLLAFDWVKARSSELGIFNTILIATISALESFPAIGVMVPGQQLLLIVGWLYGQEHFILACVSASIGACIGNWVGFFLGQKFGKQLLKKYGSAFWIGTTEQEYLEPKIKNNGAWFIILGKFHNFTRAFIPFMAWTLWMWWAAFWKYSIIGSILWSCIILSIGVFATRYITRILDLIGYIFFGILIFFILYILIFKRSEFKNYLDKKSKELS
jgi:membrane-associated protein